MSHSNTEFLIDYWQSRTFGSRLATRASIDPTDFPTLLPQVFILGRSAPSRYGFRLCGGLVRDLHGRDLRGADFLNLWAESARLPLQTALESARHEGQPLRLLVRAEAAGQYANLEITLMPLSNEAGGIDRVLGLYQPVTPLGRLRGQAVEKLTLLATEDEDRPARGHIRLAAVGGLRVG